MMTHQLNAQLAELDRRILLLEEYWLQSQQPKPQFASGTIPESMWININEHPEDKNAS